MRRGVPLIFLMLLFLLPGVLWAQAPKSPKAPAARGRALTVQQVASLLKTGLPDQAIAGEIASRGVTGLTRQTLDQLSRAGAGTATLAALNNALPHCRLVIRTGEGAAIGLDGKIVGQADSQGILILDGLDPGPRLLKVTLENHHDFNGQILLKMEGPNEIDVPLEWTAGFLQMEINDPRALVEVDGAGRIDPKVRQSLTPGVYMLTASAPLRKSERRSLVIEGGKTLSVRIALEADAAALEALERQIKQDYDAGNYRAVMTKFEEYSQFSSPPPSLLATLALSHFGTGNYGEFHKIGLRALATGGGLGFLLSHNHFTLGPGRQTGHPSVLTITRQTLSYEPKAQCNHEQFSVPLASATFSRQVVGNGEFAVDSLHVSTPNPAKPNKKISLNFLVQDDRQLEALKAFLQAAQAAH